MAKQKKEVPKQFNIDYLPLLDEMSDRSTFNLFK